MLRNVSMNQNQAVPIKILMPINLKPTMCTK